MNKRENPIRAAASLPEDELVQVAATWEELWEYFKDYDQTHLGTHTYHHKFSNGVEAKAIIQAFPKIAFIETMRSAFQPRMNEKQFHQFIKEVEANTDYLYEQAAERAGIDLAAARLITRPGLIVLFQPIEKV